MTVLDQPPIQVLPETRREAGQGQQPQQLSERKEPQRPGGKVNVGEAERIASVAAGAVMAAVGIARRSVSGAVVAGLGGALIHRGVTGHCHAYDLLGVDTAHRAQAQTSTEEKVSRRGIHVEQAFLVNRSPEELYRYWRDFSNLPRIMSHLERVDVIGDWRSHWVAKAPRIAGGRVEWDAEITRDEPNALIAWRSLSGADVDNAGEIRFAPALGDRGTEVHVFMDYIPPAGRVGKWLATLLGDSPERKVREDLRNFKRIMETGEVLTIIGQPHGTCTGVGERYTE